MQRINGDGHITSGGKKLYADEDLPTRAATQVTHQAMNSIQEEIANVIEAEGLTLNTDSEDPLTQAIQLNTAIDNKIKAPRGYIDGFQMDCTDGTGAAISPGVALDITNQKWLRKDTATVKNIQNAGALQTWVAGTGNGGVKSSDLGWWDSFVGQWTAGNDYITGIADTSNIRVGDLVFADASPATFGYGFAYVTEIISGSSVRVDRVFPENGVSITVTNKGRWLHVFAIGKTTDAAALDFVAAIDIDAMVGGFGAFDLFRRIGSVFVANNAGAALGKVFTQVGDGFHFDNYDLDTEGGRVVGSAGATSTCKIRTLSPRQVNTTAKVEIFFAISPSAAKSIEGNIIDGTGGGSNLSRGVFFHLADATYTRKISQEIDYKTGLTSEGRLHILGGASYAPATIQARTISYVDLRGKDAG